MRIAFTLVSVFFSVTMMFAQGSQKNGGLGTSGKAVDHSTHEECGAMKRHEHLMKTDPAYVQRRAEIENHYQQFLKNPQVDKVTYTIPVVVHVIHLGTAVGTGANITDAQIQSAIDNLNDAYSNTSTAFTTYTGVNTNIQFCLAQRDPSGNPTTGINRVDGSGTSTYATYGLTDGTEASISNDDNETTIKALSKWDNTKYYNIWVVTEINNNGGGAGTQGFAYFPGAGASVDGTIILYNSFGYDPDGSLGYNLKSYTNRNVTTIHEVGHALNLYHTFQGDGTGSTCPSDAVCGTSGDCVSDTPKHKRSTSSCVSDATSNTCDAGTTAGDYQHNFMDYSSDDCQTEFTNGQSVRMQAVVQAGGGRVSLMSSDGCNPVYTNEASLYAVVTPTSGSACGNNIDPVVTIKNTGSSTLTSLTISYTMDGGTAVNYSWTGSLAQGASTNVTLANVASAAGAHTFVATISNPNGVVDPYSSNDSKTVNYTSVGSTPATTCTVNTTNTGNYNSEIIRVRFNTIDNAHDDALNDGTQDFTCTSYTNLNYGTDYTLTVNADGNVKCRVYIDYNDDGAYTADEMVMNNTTSAASHTGTVSIPAYPTTTGKLIRMRVMADVNSITGGCQGTISYGEVEDYGLIIATPPCSAPSLTSSPSDHAACTGTASFTATVSGPSLSYQWQISTDGGNSYTNLSNAGVYSNVTTASLFISDITGLSLNRYRCYVNNSCGNVTTSAATLTVTTAPTAATMPNTAFTGNYCTGVINFQFNTINNSHNDEANEGTQDFTCSNNTTVTAGSSYNFTVSNYYSLYGDPGSNPCGYNSSERVTIWIDYNNDGTMDNLTERVYNSASAAGSHTGLITIPTTGITYNTLLRMRVKTDIAAIADATSDTQYGEVEDYAIFISCNPFTALTGGSCGKTLTTMDEALYSANVPCATNYRYEIRSAIDNSLITVSVRGAADNLFRMSWITGGLIKYGSNYKVRVAAYVNGAWGNYSTSCNVITPPTRLMDCDKVLAELTEAFYVHEVQGATDYKLDIRNYAAGFHTASVRGTNSNLFRLSWVAGIQLSTKYEIRATAKVNGVWKAYGPVCYVTTPVEATKLSTGSCGVSVPTLSSALYCDAVTNASNYRYEIRKASDNSLVAVSVRGSSDNTFRLSWLTGGVIQTNTTYKIRVAAYANGIWGDYGTSCNVTTPSSMVIENGTGADEAFSNQILSSVELNAYPNPSRGEVTISSNLEGTFQIVNEIGQVVRVIEITSDKGMQETVSGLSHGIYFVTINANGEQVMRKITVLD